MKNDNKYTVVWIESSIGDDTSIKVVAKQKHVLKEKNESIINMLNRYCFNSNRYSIQFIYKGWLKDCFV